MYRFFRTYPNKNSGLSLIELMVALGISAIVLGGGYKLYLEFTDVQLNASRAKTVQQEMAALGEAIRNQFSLRASEHVISSPSFELKDEVGGRMRTMEISSLRDENGSTSLLKTKFTSVCQDIAQNVASLDFSSLMQGDFVSCLSCSGGTLPVVQMTTSNPTTGATRSTRSYPFGSSSAKAKNDVLALGVCFRDHQGVAAYIEAAWVTRDKRIERASQVVKLETATMDKIKIVR